MLERYRVRPTTLDRIRASWIGAAIEQYVAWLTERGYAARNVYRRVPLLMQFGEFAQARGATSWETLPDHVEPFVNAWLAKRGRLRAIDEDSKATEGGVRGPIYQLLRVVIPGYSDGCRRRDSSPPFLESAFQFFSYLRKVRGLSDSSLAQYLHHLRCFEQFREWSVRRERILKAVSTQLRAHREKQTASHVPSKRRCLSLLHEGTLRDLLRGP